MGVVRPMLPNKPCVRAFAPAEIAWAVLSEHQRELASRRLRLRQGRKRDPEQAHPFSRWQELFEQAKAQTLKVCETVDGVVEGLASVIC